jgi:hypothetical protein
MPEPALDRSAWSEIVALPRLPLTTLDRETLPPLPGVYVLYRDEHPVFIGKSAMLRTTVAVVLSAAATPVPMPRRAAAEFLGIASAQAIREGRYRPTPEDQERITRWLKQCAVVCRPCPTESAAVDLEARLKADAPRR